MHTNAVHTFKNTVCADFTRKVMYLNEEKSKGCVSRLEWSVRERGRGRGRERERERERERDPQVFLSTSFPGVGSNQSSFPLLPAAYAMPLQSLQGAVTRRIRET